MCFEWDKRYFREQEALRISKEKTDELLKHAEEAAKAESARSVTANAAPVAEREEAEA
jgi:hypothetical protein